MKPNYCLPIIKNNKLMVAEKIRLAKTYQHVEVWLDYIEDFDFDFLHDLMIFRDKVIFVLRRQNLETPVMDPQKKLSVISALSNSGCLLDLDVVTQQEELAYLQTNNIKIDLITSYHNYQATPDESKLNEVLTVMQNYNPAIYKIATMCNIPKDGLRLLEILLKLKNEKKKYIILGMGEYGTITRLYGTLWGNEITFAPEAREESSAPGQLTRQEMETILEILGRSMKQES